MKHNKGAVITEPGNSAEKPTGGWRDKRPVVNTGLCNMCGKCWMFCPDNAIKKEPKSGKFYIDYNYCKGCGICAEECPFSAIKMEDETK
ncbi:MAG: 4Fe-4S binding protein [Candidatus Nanoarchaeia archaeon]|nr:4Fe-4S binding protein [Candidatus Nanoarchaeia archaeon]